MHEHPGASESLMLFAGGDASDVFSEVSHSPSAVKQMQDLRVPGLTLPPEGCPAALTRRQASPDTEAGVIEALAQRMYSRLSAVTADAEHIYSASAAEDAAQATAGDVEAAAGAVGAAAEAFNSGYSALRESFSENSSAIAHASVSASTRISGSYSALRELVTAAAAASSEYSAPSEHHAGGSSAAAATTAAAASAAALLNRLLGPPSDRERLSARVRQRLRNQRARLASALAMSMTLPTRKEVHDALELYFGSAEEAAFSLELAFSPPPSAPEQPVVANAPIAADAATDATDATNATDATGATATRDADANADPDVDASSVLSSFKRRTTRELLGSLEAYFGSADDAAVTIGTLLSSPPPTPAQV
jgi:hypothetical protein